MLMSFSSSIGLSPVGVRVGVPPTEVNDAINTGGKALGISNPRSFKLMSLQAMLNSIMFIFPSESVSANDLFIEIKYINILLEKKNIYCLGRNR